MPNKSKKVTPGAAEASFTNIRRDDRSDGVLLHHTPSKKCRTAMVGAVSRDMAVKSVKKLGTTARQHCFVIFRFFLLMGALVA